MNYKLLIIMPRLVDKIKLGKTNLYVSRISFGTIPFGGRGWRKDPAITPEEAALVLERAFRLGINYWDTAEGYGTHIHVREGLKRVKREEVVISTKTKAVSKEEAWQCIKNSLSELDTNYIDIYYMHYVNSIEEFRRRSGALEALLEAKDSGMIKYIGVSTHKAEVVKFLIEIPEIDVIMAKVNKIGHRIESPPEMMLEALQEAYNAGKGICIMKILAYGKLNIREALEWALSLPYVHSICIGMRTIQEVEENLRIYNELIEGLSD